MEEECKAVSKKRKAKSRKLGCIDRKLSAFCFLLAALSLTLFNCTNKSDSPSNSSPKFTQYYNQGEQLYIKHCSNCHQKNGTGLGRVYPPLNVSDFMDKNFSEVICLIRYGRQGELTVNGVSYNQPMPGVLSLTDLEIAEIATYIYNSWEHKRGIAEVKEVTATLDNCNPSK